MEKMKMEKIKVGMIGYGLAGQVFHEPLINSLEEFNLHAIYDRNPENRKKATLRYGEEVLVDHAEDLFDDQEIELIVIAVPNKSHYDLAKRALESGKHCLVEKPFTVTSHEADDLIQIAKKVNRIISVNHNRRYDSDYLTIRKLILEQSLGKVVEYEAHFDRYRSHVAATKWRESDEPGSGILYDLGSHLIDQALSLFGLPKAVFADLSTLREGASATDRFELLLDCGGIKVTLKAGMLVRENGPRYHINGSLGSFVKFGLDVQETSLRNGYLPCGDSSWGCEPENLWGTLNTEINGLHFIGKVESIPGDYCEIYRRMHQAIRFGRELEVSAEQARNTIRVIELAVESNREKRWIAYT